MERPTGGDSFIRSSLVFLLLVTSITKVLTPYDESVSIPEWLYYGSAIFEVVLVWLIVSGRRVVGCLLSMLLFATGIGLSWFYEGDFG